jgi:hypothetical protein
VSKVNRPCQGKTGCMAAVSFVSGNMHRVRNIKSSLGHDV